MGCCWGVGLSSPYPSSKSSKDNYSQFLHFLGLIGLILLLERPRWHKKPSSLLRRASILVGATGFGVKLLTEGTHDGLPNAWEQKDFRTSTVRRPTLLVRNHDAHERFLRQRAFGAEVMRLGAVGVVLR